MTKRIYHCTLKFHDRAILCSQVETLQSYFDICVRILEITKKNPSLFHMDKFKELGNLSSELLKKHELHGIDFKSEAMTFKVTHLGIDYCQVLFSVFIFR